MTCWQCVKLTLCLACYACCWYKAVREDETNRHRQPEMARRRNHAVLHLACAAQAGGFQSAIVDLDSQASAAAWHDSGEAEAPVVVALPRTRLAQGLEAARKGGAALVVVDTAPHSEATAAPPPRAADLVLIPFVPESLTYAQSGQPPSWSISPRSRPGSSDAYHPSADQLVEDARSAVAVHRLAVASMGVAMRSAFLPFPHCGPDGSGIRATRQGKPGNTRSVFLGSPAIKCVDSK